jgi:hypothetical protein
MKSLWPIELFSVSKFKLFVLSESSMMSSAVTHSGKMRA